MKVALLFLFALTRAFVVMGLFTLVAMTILYILSAHCMLREKLEARFGH